MKVWIFSFISAGLMAGSLCAQKPEIPPLPEGPLLNRTPSFSTWSVTIEGAPMGGAAATSGTAATSSPAKTSEAAGQSDDQAKSSPAKISKVVKTEPTIFEVNVDGRGQRTEMWHHEGIRVVKLPGAAAPIIIPSRSAANDIYTVDFTKSDFAGLDWIAADCYKGMAKFQGRDCIMLEGTVSPLDANAKAQEASAMAGEDGSHFEKMEVRATAYIELQSRLPLLVTFGSEKRTYQYGPAPTAPLTLPPDIATPVKAYAERMRRLSAPAARAF